MLFFSSNIYQMLLWSIKTNKVKHFYLHLACFVIYFKINISMIGGQWKIHRNSSCCCFFPYKIKNDLIIFCLKEIHSWWNCCGFWIHITITVHLIIFIANQSTFRPWKTFTTFLLDAMNSKMVETINSVLFSGFFHPDVIRILHVSRW